MPLLASWRPEYNMKKHIPLILVLILACNAVYLAKHPMIHPSMDTLLL
jgi:hypothetical protein